MQNKGAVKLLAVVLALVCIYQLSFTWVASRYEKNAKELANATVEKQIQKNPALKNNQNFVDSVYSKIEKDYLDSITGVTVYNLGIIKYTFRECNERRINLGLDLKGGMNVTLEVSVLDVIKVLSNYNNDTAFTRSLAFAQEMQKKSKDDLVSLFGKAFEQINPNGKLAAYFSTVELKDKINFNSSNKDVLKVINKEVDDAIKNSFNIIRNRIDKFGVLQPNIQQLETKGRILVELPGVKDPERVRKLLQGTANLEFWATYENPDIAQTLFEANKIIVDATGNTTIDTTQKKTENTTQQVKPDTSKNEVALLNKLKGDTATKDSSLMAKQAEKNFPLYSIFHPSIDPKTNQAYPGATLGYAHAKDTATVNRYLSLKPVHDKFPRGLRFLWSRKPMKEDKSLSFYELYAIKVSTRDGRPPLDGSVVTDARPEFGQNKAVATVSMSMNGEGAKKWAHLTKENVGHFIAIVLDNGVTSAPIVKGEIPGGNTQIEGNFTIEEANDLALILKSGKMPAPARIMEESIVGPSLGKEAINAGMLSFIVAFIGVLLYMWLYYGRAGNVANVALFTNVFFLFGVFASMGLVLTLPGFAGIVLTLAMAVDGNVIIYERMREEKRAGKGERAVVKDGFWHAYSAIIDGHVTTILTGIVLFLFGSGPVKGFATSLIVGLLLSLFSSIFIARLMFEWMLDRNINITLGNRFTINAMTKANIDFIGLRKKMYLISAVVIGIGIVSLFVRGLDPSIEFKGGRTYVVKFDKPVITENIQKSLVNGFESAPEVKTFGPTDQVKVSTKFLIEDKSAKTDSLVMLRLYEGIKGFYSKPLTYDEFTQHSSVGALGVRSSQKVDPVISNELIYQAFMAVFFGLIIIFIYIAIRFRNWKYGMGGLVSLAHDTLVVITMFTLFHGRLPFSLEIGQDFIAALLTIIGYSIMDTVIIYDRIREYKKLFPTRTLEDNINNAINHTLGRTINTSGITVVVLIVIFIFGGIVLRGFIFALLVGVITGTYSSVFNATPVAYDIIKLTEKKKDKK